MTSRPSTPSPITVTISNPTPTYGAIPKPRPSSHISLLSSPLSPKHYPHASYHSLRIRYLFTIPFIILPIVIVASLLWAWPNPDPSDPQLHWSAILIGAIGWLLTYALRRPIHALLSLTRLTPGQSAVITLISAGFISEFGRLLSLTIHTPMTTSPAQLYHPTYSHGLGWSTAESIHFTFHNLLLLRAAYRDPSLPSAVETRNALREIFGTELEDLSPWWGVMWRTSAVLMHVGCGLCVRAHKNLVWVLGTLHAIEYVVWGEYLDLLGVPGTSWTTMIIGLSVYFIGLAFFGEIV